MSKILELNSYSLYDELGDRDYMVYEVKYDDGHKEYVSRDVFRNIKAFEIIKKRKVNISLLLKSPTVIEYNEKYNCLISGSIKYLLNQEEYDLLKEMML